MWFDALLMVVILLFSLTHIVFSLLYSLCSWESMNRKRISCGAKIAGKKAKAFVGQNFCNQTTILSLFADEVFVDKVKII